MLSIRKHGRVDISIFGAQQPNAGQGRLIIDISRSQRVTRHIRCDFPGTAISPMQIQHITLTRKKRPYAQRDSNLQSQHAADR